MREAVIHLSDHAERRALKRLGWTPTELAREAAKAFNLPERVDKYHVSGGESRACWREGIKFCFANKGDHWKLTTIFIP